MKKYLLLHYGMQLRRLLEERSEIKKNIKAQKVLKLQETLRNLERSHSQYKDPLILQEIQKVKQEIDQIYRE
jgi:hypothetical protein